MSRPLRRFCFRLAEILKMPVSKLTEEVGAAELYEWMAYLITKDSDWLEKYAKDQEFSKQKEMTPQELEKYIKSQFRKT